MCVCVCVYVHVNFLENVSSLDKCMMLSLSLSLSLPPSSQFFKLEHPESGQLVYAGVLEFTSPTPEAGYLPQWMMDHLGAKEGEEMKFEHVDLPKGQFVRLQPVSSAWLVSAIYMYM